MCGSRRASILAVATLCVVSACAPAPPATPPDILLVVIDCLRGDALGTAGYPRAVTPTLDSIAAEGTVFTHAFSPSSWTRPVMPTLLTGLYPAEHGLISSPKWGDHADRTAVLPEEVETLAERLRSGGYTTALIGEQHLLSPKFGLSQGFDVYRHRTDKAGHIDHVALEWLDGLAAGATEGKPRQPFFLMLHYLDIHWPYCPPEETRGRFDKGWSDIDFCGSWRALRDGIRSGSIDLDEGDRRAMRARYDEELVGLDTEIGSLFERLRQRGLWQGTLVVVTADHGEEFFEHGSFGHGQSLFDELLHVPLVVKPPHSWDAPRGRRVDALEETTALPATLLAAAGVDPGEGVSLLPWVRGETGPKREFVVSQTDFAISVRTETEKLVLDLEGGGESLFDLVADPGETHDVAAERPRDVQRLKGMLRRWKDGLSPVTPESGDVDDETLRGLEALGYLD